MRIGQLARQYDVSLQEIISHFDEMNYDFDSDRPNAKLSDEAMDLIEERFGKIPTEENVFEESTELPEEITKKVRETNESVLEEPAELPREEIANEETETVVVEQSVEIKVEDDLPNKDQIIETDRLLELIESEDTEVDLSKITHIKASKRELEGLKVVGKIDLPEPKPKEEKVDVDEKTIAKQKDRKSGSQLSDEERDKRRLRIKKQKEQYEARQIRQKKEDENRRKRTKKKAHYEQHLQQPKPSQHKPKVKKRIPIVSIALVDQHPEPKTLFGKLWRWLNPKRDY